MEVPIQISESRGPEPGSNAMKIAPRGFGRIAVAVIALLILAGLLARAEAQVATSEIPENASEKRYGPGWRCDAGFQKAGDACELVVLPANAYLTGSEYGTGWACSYGFRQRGDLCTRVRLPEHAHIIPAFGDRWTCDRGYRRVGDRCAAIEVPANAYLSGSDLGRGWHCDRGFRAVDGVCVKIALPENAHLNFSGNGWECNKPYRERNNTCRMETDNE